MEKTTGRKTSGSFISAVIITGLIAGTLDIIGAIISYTANGGKNPTVIFQYIASAVFGKSAYNGSVSIMAAGLGFHYLIAFVFTLFFFIFYPKLRLLQSNTILVAIVYGVFVWFIMNRVVIPYFTKLDPVTFDLKKSFHCCFHTNRLHRNSDCNRRKKVLQKKIVFKTQVRILFNSLLSLKFAQSFAAVQVCDATEVQ